MVMLHHWRVGCARQVTATIMFYHDTYVFASVLRLHSSYAHYSYFFRVNTFSHTEPASRDEKREQP